MTALPDRAALTAAAFKSDYRPVWCPGCGHYSVLSSLTKALAELGVRREDVAVISGIGCSSRIPAYTSVYGFHSLHGRALPVATGLKVARRCESARSVRRGTGSKDADRDGREAGHERDRHRRIVPGARFDLGKRGS